MFFLIYKEIKYQLKSIILYIFIGVVALFYFTQFFHLPSNIDDLEPTPPEEISDNMYGLPSYGVTSVDDPMLEMQIVYSRLILTARIGQVLKHGFIINKQLNLTDEQKDFLKYSANKISSKGIVEGKLVPNVTYKEYKEIIKKVDEELGGNTQFNEKYISSYINRPKTYEEAIKSFEDIVNKDKITGAFGRIFADYMGITAGIFPIFLSAFILTRDKRFKAHEIIYNRNISSFKYILSKYIAVNIIILLCYLAFATHATFIFSQLASVSNYSINYFSFYYYTLTWVFPTVLFVTSLSFLLSIVFNNGIVTLPVFTILWFISLMPLKGEYGLSKYVIRFNTVGQYDNFIMWQGDIIFNRVAYLVVSIILVLLASLIWSWKRGNIDASPKNKFYFSKI